MNTIFAAILAALPAADVQPAFNGCEVKDMGGYFNLVDPTCDPHGINPFEMTEADKLALAAE
jgi:hypothetical protein